MEGGSGKAHPDTIYSQHDIADVDPGLETKAIGVEVQDSDSSATRRVGDRDAYLLLCWCSQWGQVNIQC